VVLPALAALERAKQHHQRDHAEHEAEHEHEQVASRGRWRLAWRARCVRVAGRGLRVRRRHALASGGMAKPGIACVSAATMPGWTPPGPNASPASTAFTAAARWNASPPATSPWSGWAGWAPG